MDQHRRNAESEGAEAASSRTWNGLGSARSSKGLSAMVASVSSVWVASVSPGVPRCRVAFLARERREISPATNKNATDRQNCDCSHTLSPHSGRRLEKISHFEKMKKFEFWTLRRPGTISLAFERRANEMAAVTMPAEAPEVRLDPPNPAIPRFRTQIRSSRSSRSCCRPSPTLFFIVGAPRSHVPV